MKKKLTRLTRGLDFLASTYTWRGNDLRCEMAGRKVVRNGGKESEARKVVIMAGRTPSSIITHHNHAINTRGSQPPPTTVDGQCDDNETGAGGE